MSDDIARVLERVADLENKLSNLVRHGTVEEVKDGFVRIRMSEPDPLTGKPFLGPWLPQGDTHYGNVREEQPYKIGQNVTMLCPNGDPAQATIWPYSPNDKNKRPDHASDQQATFQWGQHKATRDDKNAEREVGLARYRLTEKATYLIFGQENFIKIDDGVVHINPPEAPPPSLSAAAQGQQGGSGGSGESGGAGA